MCVIVCHCLTTMRVKLDTHYHDYRFYLVKSYIYIIYILPVIKGQLAPRCRALDAMIKKFYHGIQKAVHQFRFKNVEHLLGSGGNHNLRPSCRRPPIRTFHPPVGTQA